MLLLLLLLAVAKATPISSSSLAKCFGQPPPDALVKIEITLASTDNDPRPVESEFSIEVCVKLKLLVSLNNTF